MTRVMTVVGTRPEIIRLSRVLPRLDASFEHVLVHTGQNHSKTLSQIFFDELDLRPPDVRLDVDTTSLATVLAGVLVGVEAAIKEHRPDAFVVLGDTNSCISAVIAKRMRVPVYHLEAGNRCFDENVPEETNRRLVDHVADFNLVYTEHARRNLLAEGLPARRIYLTGSPMREVLEHYRPRIDAAGAARRMDLTPKDYLLVSAHREENVDNAERLDQLLTSLTHLHKAMNMPVLVSTHPRTRARLDAAGISSVDGVRFHEPLGLLDYCSLQLDAACVLSDSGTISEESLILGFPAVTLRDSIERPEALDTAGIVTCGVRVDEVVPAVELVMTSGAAGHRPDLPTEYLVNDFSHRVVNLIRSTAGVHAQWAGLSRARLGHASLRN